MITSFGCTKTKLRSTIDCHTTSSIIIDTTGYVYGVYGPDSTNLSPTNLVVSIGRTRISASWYLIGRTLYRCDLPLNKYDLNWDDPTNMFHSGGFATGGVWGKFMLINNCDTSINTL